MVVAARPPDLPFDILKRSVLLKSKEAGKAADGGRRRRRRRRAGKDNLEEERKREKG